MKRKPPWLMAESDRRLRELERRADAEGTDEARMAYYNALRHYGELDRRADELMSELKVIVDRLDHTEALTRLLELYRSSAWPLNSGYLYSLNSEWNNLNRVVGHPPLRNRYGMVELDAVVRSASSMSSHFGDNWRRGSVPTGPDDQPLVNMDELHEVREVVADLDNLVERIRQYRNLVWEVTDALDEADKTEDQRFKGVERFLRASLTSDRYRFHFVGPASSRRPKRERGKWVVRFVIDSVGAGSGEDIPEGRVVVTLRYKGTGGVVTFQPGLREGATWNTKYHVGYKYDRQGIPKRDWRDAVRNDGEHRELTAWLYDRYKKKTTFQEINIEFKKSNRVQTRV